MSSAKYYIFREEFLQHILTRDSFARVSCRITFGQTLCLKHFNQVIVEETDLLSESLSTPSGTCLDKLVWYCGNLYPKSVSYT